MRGIVWLKDGWPQPVFVQINSVAVTVYLNLWLQFQGLQSFQKTPACHLCHFLPFILSALSLLLIGYPRADFIAVILLTDPQQMGIDLVSAAWLGSKPLTELVKGDFCIKIGKRSSSTPCCILQSSEPKINCEWAWHGCALI